MSCISRMHIYDDKGRFLADYPAQSDFLCNLFAAGKSHTVNGRPAITITAEHVKFTITTAFKEFGFCVYEGYTVIKVS